MRGGGHHVRRAGRRGAGADRKQGAGDRRGAGGRAAGAGVLGAVGVGATTCWPRRESMRFPLFVKAVAGGGGRGMRRVTDAAALAEAIEAASREAESAFGDAMRVPRAGGAQAAAHRGADPRRRQGQRDPPLRAGLQRAAAPPEGDRTGARAEPGPPSCATRICADAVAFARQIGYTCAGTVEFLLDERGNHVFIEMNPRIQVEHTVTEEITDVDLVSSQLRIAAGQTLDELGLSQDSIQIRTVRRCNAGSPPRTRLTGSGPTPDGSRLTAPRAARASGWTAAPTSARRSARTSTRCWSS